MKKILSLLLALLLILIVFAPIMVIAEAPITDPPDNAVTVTIAPAEPETKPTIVYTTGADPLTPIDLTPLLQAILSLAVSLITAFLLPWIKAKYSTEQRQRIAAVYSTIVYAAEQLFGAGKGEQKLQWATDQLAAKGFQVDRAILEAEVKKMSVFGDMLTLPTPDE